MAETYKQIAGDMCDFHDYYRDVARDLPNGARIVEVGVADGHSAIFLAETLHSMGKDFEMYLVDSMDYGKDEQANTIIRNIIRSGLGDKITLIQKGSLDASCKWPDGWAHYVFIDASHLYEETKADIRLWYRKVMDGFYIAGHDFNSEGVKMAVTEVFVHDFGKVDIIDTEKNYGVWEIKKDIDIKLC